MENVATGTQIRQRRELRAPAPEILPFLTPDGSQLRLTRYQAGSKGPVVLSHGLGVSGRIFSTDTIETNLVEYLSAHEYDIWVLDHRASVELPASRTQFSGDDVALQDYPAAMAEVRSQTRSKDVQMVVHCYGATTFFMAQLAGLEGVRSVVASQIGPHVEAAMGTRLKTNMRTPNLLGLLGVDALTAEFDEHDWTDRFYDKALSMYPLEDEEKCDNPVCRRITFMYSLLYEHDQLSEETHDNLEELFGSSNMTAFKQLGLMARKKHIVAADGSEAYLPHMDRLQLPITFIHGAENACFLPRSTEITYEYLREHYGEDRYRRHVIPNYGHIDCIFGKDAHRDVFPYIVEHLERDEASV
jgi:cholesterol oxidase